MRFTMTFAHVRGTIPVDAAHLAITDELGAAHRPEVSVKGGRAAGAVRTGHDVTFVLRTTLPIGNGRVESRTGGARAPAACDDADETD